MEYFLSHILYIVIAAFAIAALGIVAVIAANKSTEESIRHEGDPDWHCDTSACQGCPGCKFFQFCDPEEKRKEMKALDDLKKLEAETGK